MNKAELIAAVAENAELTKKDAEKAVADRSFQSSEIQSRKSFKGRSELIR